MAAGMINISRTKTAEQSVSSTRYIMRPKEAIAIITNMGSEKNIILNRVEKYSDIEKIGSKDLSIRGRHDAQCMAKLVITLDNNDTIEQNTAKLKSFLKVSSIDKYPHVAAIHRGENGKEGITNRHAHINFFQRSFVSGTDENGKALSIKNPLFASKKFIDVVKSQYQSVWGLSPNAEARDRVGRLQYQSKANKNILENDRNQNTGRRGDDQRSNRSLGGIRERLERNRIRDTGTEERIGADIADVGKEFESSIGSDYQPTGDNKNNVLKPDGANKRVAENSPKPIDQKQGNGVSDRGTIGGTDYGQDEKPSRGYSPKR